VTALLTGLGQDQFRFLGGPIKQRYVADALNQRSAELPGNFLQNLVASRAVANPDARFDEFMMAQSAVDFGKYGFGQSAAADHDDRLEVVSQTAQLLALFFGQFHCEQYSFVPVSCR